MKHYEILAWFKDGSGIGDTIPAESEHEARYNFKMLVSHNHPGEYDLSKVVRWDVRELT